MKRRPLFRPAVQDAHSDPVLPEIDRRHQWQNHIVQGHGDGSRNFVAFAYPRHADGQEGFHAPERSEAKENSDRRTERDRMRRVRNRHQRHMMRSQPSF